MTREEARVLLKMMFAFWANTHERTNVEMEMALNLALTALRPVSRERVEKLRGEWMFPIFADQQDENDPRLQCSECGSIETPLARHRFCPSCGTPMTDEAVEMVMERLEALKDD